VNVTCRNDVAENFSFDVKQQSFTHFIQVSQLYMAKLLIIPECLSSSRTLLFSFLCSVLWIIVDICPCSFCELFCLPFHLQLLINFLVSSNFPLLCFIKQEFINPKARLASLYCIEVHVPSTENERSCVCVWVVAGRFCFILRSSDLIVELFQQCDIFCFPFYSSRSKTYL